MMCFTMSCNSVRNLFFLYNCLVVSTLLRPPVICFASRSKQYDTNRILCILASEKNIEKVVIAMRCNFKAARRRDSRFLPRCMECRRGLAMRILSVRLSVRSSATRVDCDRTVERSVQIYIPYERTFSLVF